MKIAILGGSFDPPHKGHVVIARKLLKLFHFDEVWLLPLFQHPFNKKLSASDKRLEMTKYLKTDRVKVCDYEIKKKTMSFTIDTLKFLTKHYPENQFSFVIGTDQITKFSKWKNWQEIIKNFKLIVVPRNGFKKGKLELENVVFVDRKEFAPIPITSTSIRQKVKKNQSISNLVPKKVEKYIIQNKLYI